MGASSRWNIASAAYPYGYGKAACQVQTLLQAHLDQNHHINCQLMCLHAARINPWEKLVDPGHAVSRRGLYFQLEKQREEVSSQMCGQRQIHKLRLRAICHVDFWQHLCQCSSEKQNGSKSLCRDLLGCDHMRRFVWPACFISLLWMFGGGIKLFRGPRAGQKLWMSRLFLSCCWGVFRGTRTSSSSNQMLDEILQALKWIRSVLFPKPRKQHISPLNQTIFWSLKLLVLSPYFCRPTALCMVHSRAASNFLLDLVNI